MTELNQSAGIFALLLVAVVISSGCIESERTDLKPDFNLEYSEVDLNRSGQEVYDDSMSQIDNISEYQIEADNRMAINLPVISVSANMTSEGIFEQETSEINTSGTMGLNMGGNSNITGFETWMVNSEDGTTIKTEMMGESNTTELEKYSREDISVSLEALRNLAVENASVLGVDEEEMLLLEVKFNATDLMMHSSKTFETLSPVQESVEDGRGIEESGSFDDLEAYLWAERESLSPSKFAYYGSADNGSLQIRSVTSFER